MTKIPVDGGRMIDAGRLRRDGLPKLDFSDPHVRAAWPLTAKVRNWNAANGVFSGLKPAKPLSFDGDGWGALGLALRYGLAREDLPPTAGGIRGSEQEARTVGLNWYVNNKHPLPTNSSKSTA